MSCCHVRLPDGYLLGLCHFQLPRIGGMGSTTNQKCLLSLNCVGDVQIDIQHCCQKRGKCKHVGLSETRTTLPFCFKKHGHELGASWSRMVSPAASEKKDSMRSARKMGIARPTWCLFGMPCFARPSIIWDNPNSWDAWWTIPDHPGTGTLGTAMRRIKLWCCPQWKLTGSRSASLLNVWHRVHISRGFGYFSPEVCLDTDDCLIVSIVLDEDPNWHICLVWHIRTGWIALSM
jgi:hypothetical protein